MLDSARGRLAKAVEPPAEAPGETSKATQKRFLVLNYNARTQAQAAPILDRWGALVDLRIMVIDGKAEAAARQLAATPPPASWATLDLLQTLAGEPIPEAPGIATSATALRKVLAAHSEIPASAVTQLFNSLPEAEIAGRMPPYREAKRPMLAMKSSPADLNAQGYRVTEPNGQGVMTVRFRGDNSTEAIIEEMALLHAADLARQGGKKGFIVVGDRSTKYSVVTTSYGTPIRSDPNGFDVEFDVLLVDPTALPTPYRDAAWRVWDADQVYEALSPIYVTTAPPSH